MANRLAGNISGTFITRVVIIAMGVVGSVITARFLGPAGKGILATLAVISGTVMQFGNFGLHASNTYFIAKNKDLTRQVIINALYTGLVGGTLITGLAFLAIHLSPAFLGNVPTNLIYLTLITIPISFIIMFFQNILIGQGRVRLFNYFELGASMFGLAGIIIIFLLLHFSIYALVIFSTITAGLAAIFYVLSLKKYIYFPLYFNGRLFRQMLQYGYKSYIASLLSYFIIRSDILLLNYFRGSAETGIYSIAVQFNDFLYLLPMTSGLMLFPTIAAQPDNQEKTRITQHLSRHISIIMACLCLVGALAVFPVVKMLYGQAFIQAVWPFLILLPGIYFLSIETILMNDFGGRGLPPIVYIAPACGLVFNVLVNIIAIPRFGMNIAAATSSIGYGITLYLAGRYFIRLTNSRWSELILPRRQEIRETLNWAIGIVRNKIKGS